VKDTILAFLDSFVGDKRGLSAVVPDVTVVSVVRNLLLKIEADSELPAASANADKPLEDVNSGEARSSPN
jgi:hypothetical protein